MRQHVVIVATAEACRLEGLGISPVGSFLRRPAPAATFREQEDRALAAVAVRRRVRDLVGPLTRPEVELIDRLAEGAHAASRARLRAWATRSTRRRGLPRRRGL